MAMEKADGPLVKAMMGTGRTLSAMGKARTYSPQDLATRVSGLKTSKMATVYITLPQARDTKATGKMEKGTDLESIGLPQELGMKETG